MKAVGDQVLPEEKREVIQGEHSEGALSTTPCQFPALDKDPRPQSGPRALQDCPTSPL